MSMHKTHAHDAQLQQALQDHRLPHDEPSQLADCFRSGWLAALTQRPAAQSEAQALAHNMMLWREDAVHNGNEYVPVHVRTLEKVIAQLRDMPAPQQATPASAPQSLLMRLAGIAAECSDPDTTDALDALIATTQQATPTRATREAEQRARMQARLATRHEGKATADFDLPPPNDAIQQATPEPVGGPIKYQPGEWYEAKDRDDLEAFFRSRLPAIREAAREHGYAIGLHGSMRRDLDLIAVPWRDGASDRDVLAHAIAMAACGITRDGPYQWEQKPLGRVAAILSCCWPRWFNEAGAGHIDLSVVDPTRAAPGVPEGFALVPVEPTEEMTTAVEHAMWDKPSVKGADVWSAVLAAAQAKGEQ